MVSRCIHPAIHPNDASPAAGVPIHDEIVNGITNSFLSYAFVRHASSPVLSSHQMRVSITSAMMLDIGQHTILYDMNEHFGRILGAE